MKITLKQLKPFFHPKPEFEKFAKKFPSGVEITPANLEKILKYGDDALLALHACVHRLINNYTFRYNVYEELLGLRKPMFDDEVGLQRVFMFNQSIGVEIIILADYLDEVYCPYCKNYNVVFK